MATLHIKNFPDSLYEKLKELARQEHRSLAQQVIHLLQEAVDQEPVFLLELRKSLEQAETPPRRAP
jgi:plasmid stability protein